MSKKEEIINQLVENGNYAYPNEIKAKLRRKSLSVIKFWMSMTPNNKALAVENIIRIG